MNNVVGNSFPWGIFTLFVGITSTCWIAMQFSPDSLIVLFERFYRYGYLVFGGGQVVVPVMQGELVDQTGLLTAEEFLSGFGLVQALPGPMFSFAAFAGGLSENHRSSLDKPLHDYEGVDLISFLQFLFSRHLKLNLLQERIAIPPFALSMLPFFNVVHHFFIAHFDRILNYIGLYVFHSRTG